MKPIEKLRLGKKRSMLLSDVSGDVLEIGFGTGVNLGYYPYEQIDSLNLMDMDLPKHLNTSVIPSDIPFEITSASITSSEMPDNSYDSIVFTLVFCTVDDPILAYQR